MIRIEFVKVGNRIVPRSFSDRWNAEWLGIPTDGLSYDRNGSALKRLRRAFEKEGFTFALVKGDSIEMTDVERAMFPARKVA